MGRHGQVIRRQLESTMLAKLGRKHDGEYDGAFSLATDQ